MYQPLDDASREVTLSYLLSYISEFCIWQCCSSCVHIATTATRIRLICLIHCYSLWLSHLTKVLLHSWQRYGEASDGGCSGGGDKGGDQNLQNTLNGVAMCRILCPIYFVSVDVDNMKCDIVQVEILSDHMDQLLSGADNSRVEEVHL